MLWYWKIDSIVGLLQQQKELLENIHKSQGGQSLKSTDLQSEIERKAKLYDDLNKK
jgi:hypothetical protein